MSNLPVRFPRWTCILVVAVPFLISGTVLGATPMQGARHNRADVSAKRPEAGFVAAVNKIVDSAYVKNHLPSVTVVIASHGIPFYKHSDGYLNLAKKIPASPDSAYHIGSVSKQFTAASILLLAESKKLSIDDPVSKYFPKLDRRVTLRQMMTMTSGFKDYSSLPQIDEWGRSGVSPSEVAAALAPMPLNFTPGTAFQYSNTNYLLLAGVIEKVSSLKFADFLRQRLLASTNLESIYEDKVPDVPNATGYTGKNNQPAPELAPSLLLGAGGISASMMDLVQWNRLLLGGRILPSHTVAIMTTPPPRVKVFKSDKASMYAMGLGVIKIYGLTEIAHTGTIDPGYKATTGTFPGLGWSIAIAVNNSSFDIDRLRKKIERAACGPSAGPGGRCR